ncbi:MAG TPA: hypothetical protein VGH63_02005, partial [Polyangia bacterium]
MRIGTKLAIGYSAIGFTVVAASICAVTSTEQQLTALGRAPSELLSETTRLSALSESAIEESYAYVVSNEPGERDSSESKAAEFGRRLRALPNVASDSKGSFSRLLKAERAFTGARHVLFADFDRSKSVSRSAYEQYEEAIDELTSAMNEVIEAQTRAVKGAQKRALTMIRTSTAIIVGIAVLALALSLVVAVILGRHITRPLSQLRDAAVAFGAGFDVDVT